MKYTILTLGNPERQKYIKNIRRHMRNFEEVFVECVNGKDTEQLNANIEKHGFDINFSEWRPGEGGVWYSNINAWRWSAFHNEDLMVFEDDAILDKTFRAIIENIELPEDYDFITWYVPYNSAQNIMPIRLEKTYQEHGNVCIQYSAKGTQKIISMLTDEGLEWPIDIWLFKKALSGKLEGYSPSRLSYRFVGVDLEIPTNIHDDDKIKVWRTNAV